jgi:hypothetical protein
LCLLWRMIISLRKVYCVFYEEWLFPYVKFIVSSMKNDFSLRKVYWDFYEAFLSLLWLLWKMIIPSLEVHIPKFLHIVTRFNTLTRECHPLIGNVTVNTFLRHQTNTSHCYTTEESGNAITNPKCLLTWQYLKKNRIKLGNMYEHYFGSLCYCFWIFSSWLSDLTMFRYCQQARLGSNLCQDTG